MDTVQIIQILTAAPFQAILLYLLIREQNQHEATRVKAREVELDLYNRNAALTERAIVAIDKLENMR